MDNTKVLEQKLEELVAQLNELLAQLSGVNSNVSVPIDTPKNEPIKTVENLEHELQRLKASRKTEPQLPKKDTKKNGWNYVSSYLQNRR
jgi:hypothetical protein